MSIIPGKPTGVPRSLYPRFLRKIDRSGDCHLWLGHVTPNGYGRWTWSVAPQRAAYAHRLAWEIANGPVPEGLVLDHICRNRRCVNVDHLRLATVAQNVLCGDSRSARNAMKTHCKRGHEFTPENTYRLPSDQHGRHCRACKRDRDRRSRATQPTIQTQQQEI